MAYQPEQQEHDDRLAALLRSIESDAPPPDAHFLAALGDRSLSEFNACSNSPQSPTGESAVTPAPYKPRKTMFTLALRGALALAASVAAIAAWMNFSGPAPVSGAPFADILSQLRAAKTLELRIVKDGHAAEVSIAAPGLVRYQDSKHQYRIAAGSRLWRIDEEHNTATSMDSPWFVNPREQIDLIALLEIGVTDSAPLMKARPSGQSHYDGRPCNVYAAELPTRDGEVEVEAFVDPSTMQLLGMTARPAGGNNNGPPLAEMQLVAMNAGVDETKFVVAKSLSDDGRIGKIADLQGVVVLRPVLAQRWTPIARETTIKTGDWLRTDIWGANAVKVRLTSDVEVTLGPGTLIEFISPHQARLHSGETQVNIPEKTKPKSKPAGKKDADAAAEAEAASPPSFELLAPRTGAKKFATPGKAIVRVDRAEALIEVKQAPKWLAAFEGASANESLGSLIVKLPDGRNEPLSVGYHKVSVEIRDQIARTTIEESFVNNTDARLEGVFHFPLPQDASISGFGMWIGDNLVEADVVEQQRAREIYETILREKRDPGLLEWTSGNLFKARVFPIESHSEKRVKIVYTQVLPLRANQYRYTYGLRSDLLRLKPVRELSLTVTLNSAIPLKNVACPTHSARIEHTRNSAQVEFAAQEYSPDRDFEVVCQVDAAQSDVVVVPHRRGSDGYLLVQLTPPAPAGNWQRELLPEGQPLDVVLLCDTSGSMDSEKRKQQAEFVATVLSSLGEKDRFMLAGTDVSTAWVANEPLPVNVENVAKARDFLEHRVSLGWTDLDQAFDTVLRKAPPHAQIVYIGDGIVSSGDRSAAAFVRRLEKMLAEKKTLRKDEAKDKTKDPVEWVLHSVTVGNVHEQTVMKGIAGVGHGSSRAISGDQTPRIVAREWLNEIAQPGMRDLKVEFRGVSVAAMYPDRLPNVAAGTQQILVGRYLPKAKDQQGEVIVTGKRGDETVRYAAKIDFKDAEEGNSFIPRLWARSHLDFLLEQGSSPTVRDDIIAISEEFHIITPFTSLLVLESDADRERFGVKRRYEMRDGERFFAEGKATANFELAQQQTKQARDWQLGLRRGILAQWATLGRDARWFQRPGLQRFAGGHGPLLQAGGGGAFLGEDKFRFGLISSLPGLTGRLYGGDETDYGSTTVSGGTLNLGGLEYEEGQQVVDSSQTSEQEGEPLFKRKELELGRFEESSDRSDLAGLDQTGKGGKFFDDDEKLLLGPAAAARPMGEFDKRLDDRESNEPWDARGLQNGRESQLFLGSSLSAVDSLSETRGPIRYDQAYSYYGRRYYPNTTSWIGTLFPALGGPPPKPPVVKDSPNWSAEAIALSKSLSRLAALRKLAGGVEMTSSTDSFDPVWKRMTYHSGNLALYSPAAWLTKPADRDSQSIVNYCDKKRRGVFSLAFLLGMVRPSIDRDLITPPLALGDWSLSPLHESYRGWAARVEKAEEHQAKLVLSAPGSSSEQRFTIDTDKHVVIKQESLDEGKSTGATSYSDFVLVAGSWWAQNTITTDGKDRKVAESVYRVKELALDMYEERIKAELVLLPRVQQLQQPLPRIKDARQRVADGSATFDDRILMILDNCQLQQWDEVSKHLDAAEKLAADKTGVRWLRPMIDIVRRRNEEARQWLLKEGKLLSDKRQLDDAFLAEFIVSQLLSVGGPAESVAALQVMKPAYDRQPADSNLHRNWQSRMAELDDQLGRVEDSLAIHKKLAADAPWDVSSQADYARRLMQAGQAESAYAWLDKQLARPEERTSYDDDTLHTAYADLYRMQTRWAELLKFTTAWVDRKPESTSPYQQHLSALVYNDRLDAANALVHRWFKEGRIEGKIPADARARLDAAIEYAHGNSYNLSFYRAWPQWLGELSETARFFVRIPEHVDIAQRAVGFYRINDSDAGDRLRGFYLNLLQSDLEKLTPEQIAFLVSNVLSGRLELDQPIDGRRQVESSELPRGIWKKIATRLHDRWEKAKDKEGKLDKHALGEALRTIYANRFSDTELLPFLRERIENATADLAPSYIAALFDALLSEKWTDAIEREAFDTLPRLTVPAGAGLDAWAQAAALHRLDDAMLAGRQTKANAALQDKGDVDKLTRTELFKKRAQIRQEAIAGLVERLAAEAKRAEDQKDRLADWLRMEQGWLNVQLSQIVDGGDATAKAAQHKRAMAYRDFCWTKLGELPPKPQENGGDDEPTPDKIQQALLDGMVRRRAFTSVMYLASQRSAEPQSIERLVKYIDAGIGYGGDAAAAWKQTKFQLLVVLDRTEQLERELRAWIRDDATTAPWRKTLAMVVAELGKLEEAVQLYEKAEKDHLLTAGDYRTLAGWNLALNRREAFETAQYQSFLHMPEGYLSRYVDGVRNRWQSYGDRPLPTELDENVLLAFRALFEKSANPSNYLWRLRELYMACRDFRLLQMIPDSMLGRSPQQVYPFLQALQSSLLGEMRKESTADEILARIKKLRERDLTAIDGRALDLLEAMIERQSAEVQNQRGPHVEACLATLRRAFERKWSDGEPRLMANFLVSLNHLPDDRLRDEQLRELRELLKRTPAASRDHLAMTSGLSRLLYWQYGQKREGLDLFEVEIRAYDDSHRGLWPYEDDQVLDEYASMLQDAGRHVAGEALLKKYLDHPASPQQTAWLDDRLWTLYNHALEHQGEVSLGKGDPLLQALLAYGEKHLADAKQEDGRQVAINHLIQTLDIARRGKIAGAADAIRKLAFETIPVVLRKQQSLYSNTATSPLNLVREALGRREALTYIVERMEQWPARLEVTQNNAWSALAYALGEDRSVAENDVPDLQARALKLVVVELKQYLATGETQNQYIFFKNSSSNYYWAAKQVDFAKAAEDVYREYKSSGRRVTFIANYLWFGIDAHDRAIEILLVANGDGVLDQGGRQTLAQYLHDDARFAESISVLEPLVAELPDNMRLRVMLMRAYHHSKRPAQLGELVARTDKHFHGGGRWTDDNVSQFAAACFDCALLDKAAGLFREAISARQRNHPRAGSGDATLSSWYQQLAGTESALGHTQLAVDAASGAIECWGATHPQRAAAMTVLHDVLRQAKDLDDFVKHWDDETTKSGEDSAIIRKMLGMVYLEDRHEFKKAVPQLDLAKSLQPNDKEIYQGLIRSYDEMHEPKQATKELLALVDFDRHDLSLYTQLAKRLSGDEAEAERAATSIVEAGPTEAENHQALAELRQTQNRWNEAIDQWREAAELRRLEPTGLVKLAEAQVHQKRWDAARKTVDKLRTTDWPSRFNNVQSDIERLRGSIQK